jgi:membrane protease subunit HflC
MHQHNRHSSHDHDHHHLHDDQDHHHHHPHEDGSQPERPLLQRLKERWRWLLVGGVLVFAYLTFYTVRETEFVLVTQFGQPLYTVSDAGLHLKWFFQTANRFDRRLHVYNPRPSEFLTRDKKNLVVENYVAWRVENPSRFVETVGDIGAAEMRLHDIVWSGLSASLGSHDLEAIVSVDTGSRRIGTMMDGLLKATDRAALAQYGIRVVDVRIKRLNLPEQNKQSVFARMRAERERIARQYRAEGEEQALRIRAEADRQREEILSAAYKEAEQIKGAGEAESARVYGAAYSKNPRFYKLLRTLESYRKIFDDKTTAILSTDSELLRVLMRGEGAVQ